MPARRSTTAQQDRALALYESGTSHRDIQRELGVQNTRSLIAAALRRRGLRLVALRRNQVITVPLDGSTPTPDATALGRPFGVEIEVEHISAARAAAAVRAAGFDCRVEDYNHEVRPWWKVVPDGSLNGGCEIVSPILHGEDGLARMREVMGALRGAGAEVNARCGFHVHHDVSAYTGETLARFVEQWVALQGTIDQLVSPSRREGRSIYLRHLSDRDVQEHTTRLRARRGVAHGGTRGDARYRTLNVTPLPKYGTFEIRQHQGTLNGTKDTAWVRMGWAMFDAVDAQVALPTDAHAFISQLVDAHGLHARSGSNLRARLGDQREAGQTVAQPTCDTTLMPLPGSMVPTPTCRCDVCRAARDRRGADFHRTRSSRAFSDREVCQNRVPSGTPVSQMATSTNTTGWFSYQDTTTTSNGTL